MNHAALRYLPEAMFLLAPELRNLPLPVETRSDCVRCPLAGDPFLPDVRCCTYEPSVPGFLVGRALQRGGTGAELVRTRLEQPSGRTARGVGPSASWRQQYAEREGDAFGRERAWTCPYWQAGPLGCSVWEDRSAVCRTWHCRHTHGMQGHLLWIAVRGLLALIEERLMVACRGLPAPADDANGAAWGAYYASCWETVEQLDASALCALEDEELTTARRLVRERLSALDGPLPDVLSPDVREVREVGRDVELVGYSPYSPVRLPKAVYVLLSEMDGHTPWPEAVRRAQQVEPAVEASWVAPLVRHGVLRAVDDVREIVGLQGPEFPSDRLEELLKER